MAHEPDIDFYEPDDEDFAYLRRKERELKSLCAEHGDIARQLHDYHKHTDRQLRDMSKKRNAIARKTGDESFRDVVDDTFDVDKDGETFIVGGFTACLDRLDEALLTRKDKRRAKTERRKAVQQKNFDFCRGDILRRVSG